MKRNEVIVSGRQKDKRVLERVKESNVRLYKNGLTFIGKILLYILTTVNFYNCKFMFTNSNFYYVNFCHFCQL
jgi:hypothetical protein